MQKISEAMRILAGHLGRQFEGLNLGGGIDGGILGWRVVEATKAALVATADELDSMDAEFFEQVAASYHSVNR